MKKWIGKAGLIALLVVVGVRTDADVLVRDEFNTTGGPDYANGLYSSGADIGDTGGNATCTGGTIVGFDASKAWNQAAYFDAYANVLRLLHRTYGATYEGRGIVADLSGKTVAYARTSMRMRSSAASASAAYAYAGFGSNASLGSGGGATVGFNWDSANSEWDLALRYNNGTTAISSNILEGVAVDSTYGIIWKMDDAADTISVWVNETNLNRAASLAVSDWGGSIVAITHLTAGFSETGSSGDIYVYDMLLGDSAEDVGAVETPGLLAYDAFDTDGATPDYANGIYLSGADLADTAGNATCHGGGIAGFDASNAWNASGYYDAYAQKVRLLHRTYSSAATASRALTVPMAGKTKACASAVLRVGAGAQSGAQVLAGFSDATMSSTKGAAIGYKWDGANWDMVLRYNNGSAAFATIREDVAPDEYNTFYWSMDQNIDTIKVWVNTNDYSTPADLVVTDWQGTVSGITHFTSSFHSTGTGDAYLDTIKLGDTPESVGMSAPPASGFVFALYGPPDTDLYVAPSALGNGLGLDAGNAAACTNAAFWSRVQDTLDTDPVVVNLLDGNYRDTFELTRAGNPNNTLSLLGESSSGVIFDGTNATLFSLGGCQNMVLEKLNFTGNGSGIGYAFRVTHAADGTPSQNIAVRNCNWHDMQGIIYGATGVAYGSHDVTYENCTFERIGQNTGSHMMYNAYNATNVNVLGCHFEDCAGSYVRFRAASNYGTVSNCTFVSTQTYANRSSTWEVFLDFPVFNDVDPGDETFALYPTIVGNSFQFDSSSPANRATIRFYHKGYDPTGWNYLMTPSEGSVLEGTDSAAKKSLLKNNCGIDFDEIAIGGNTWLNETARIMFGSYAAYGATSKGWDDIADVSDIVFSP